jgi:hypothetical protein
VWSYRDYQYPRPEIVTPAPGTQLQSSSAVFNWTAHGFAGAGWWFYVGTTPGGREIHDSGRLPVGTTSDTVNGLPLNGQPLYARLWYLPAAGGAWLYDDFQFTAFSPSAPAMVTPTPGTKLAGPTATFAWNDDSGTTQAWWLHIGTSLGAYNILNSGSIPGATTSRDVSGLPVLSQPIYVRLWYLRTGIWAFTDFVYTGAGPSLQLPVPGTVLSNTGGSITFQWDPSSTAVTSWWLYVGTTSGAADIHDSGRLTADTHTRTVNGVGVGKTVYVRLWFLVNGAWQFLDFPFAVLN